MLPGLSDALGLVHDFAGLALVVWFVWWRTDRLEARLARVEERLGELARRDAELGERVARLEGRWNGALRRDG